MEKGPISNFITHNYRHFNSASLVDAAKAYEELLAKGGKMMLAMAGAMSTAELGLSLAEMIRQDKFSIVCCSANNLEEDIMNLVAHSHYYRVPGYRNLTAEQEQELLNNHYNRVTDTCIPEEEAFRRLEGALVDVWNKAKAEGKRYLPYEYIYQILRSGVLENTTRSTLRTAGYSQLARRTFLSSALHGKTAPQEISSQHTASRATSHRIS